MKATTPAPDALSAPPGAPTPDQPYVPMLKRLFDDWHPETTQDWKATTEECLGYAASLAEVLDGYTWQASDRERGGMFPVHHTLELLSLLLNLAYSGMERWDPQEVGE